MSVTSVPACIQAPRLVQKQLLNANNANRDGTGSLSAALAVGANGSLIHYFSFTPITTTAAGTLRVFYDDGAGAGKLLVGEIQYAAATLSATVGATTYTWFPPANMPMPAAAGGNFYFTFSNNSETWNGSLAGADF